MITKSLFILVALFVAYNIFVSIKPKLSSSQNQWQDNLVKAQNYIYDENDTFNNVIVGSSLSCKLIMDSLPQVFNLSFSGQSIFDGLRIVKSKKRLPRNIFIETNVVLRKEDTEFTNSLVSQSPFSFKKHFLSLRADKQPIPILIGYLDALSNIISKKTKSIIGRGHEVGMMIESKGLKSKYVNNELFNRLLKAQIEDYSRNPDYNLLIEQVNLLKFYINYFELNGVNIIFLKCR